MGISPISKTGPILTAADCFHHVNVCVGVSGRIGGRVGHVVSAQSCDNTSDASQDYEFKKKNRQ